jgi:hypothetical protein
LDLNDREDCTSKGHVAIVSSPSSLDFTGGKLLNGKIEPRKKSPNTALKHYSRCPFKVKHGPGKRHSRERLKNHNSPFRLGRSDLLYSMSSERL